MTMTDVRQPVPEAPDVRRAPALSAPTPGSWTRVWTGRDGDPRWVRPALLALLAATAALYLWGLGASGWANSYYSAAVQAGTRSWKAFFFGSFDAANFITVDKAPAFLWPMELSARLFGLSSWSILVPQALEGVAAVGLLYAAVRRWFSPAAALLAGTVLALTPISALMFRFNNPDALLTLLLVAAAYAVVRALEGGRLRWVLAVGALVGFAFLAKMLQSLLVVPGFAGLYLLAAPVPVRRRLAHLFAAGAAFLVSAGWWVAAVLLIPGASRPYIGGSQTNSLWNLIWGYNGFGRLTGNETGSVGGAPTATGRWGPTGLTRLFNADFGGQISWLLPAALIALGALLAVTWRARRTDRVRAAAVLWGGWLLVTGIAFSIGQGIIHPYYTAALGPPIAALVGIGGTLLWRRRHLLVMRAVLAVAVGVTAWWSYHLLGRTPAWHPALRGSIVFVGLVAAWAIAFLPRLPRAAAVAVAGTALAAALAGPAAYSLQTAATAHTGAIPSAGPAVAGRLGAPGGAFGGGPPGGFTPPRGAFAGGGGGLLDASAPSAAVVSALQRDSSRYTWVLAAVGANRAAGYQLATGEPVMAIGGFNGSDPTPTLQQFESYVHAGKIHYFVAGGVGGPGGFGGFAGPGGFGGGPDGFGGGPGGGGSSTGSAISSWVQSHFTHTTVGGVTLYDLTSPV
jgi:4-amino-4-deoxy-L-arabinose transferase-like glycosyltransferase